MSTDVFSPSERSAVMRAVQDRGTALELTVRRLAHAIRPGHRLNAPELPGRPDLVWRKTRHAVFVHGCFWHGHDCARGARTPKQNAGYWISKIAGNRARDAGAVAALKADGWRVLTIWECALRDEAAVAKKLRSFLA
jgi:DNA mismatch endonuclease (patch repair protein)